MTESQKSLEVVRQGPRANVILSRPEVRNAFDDQMISQLSDAFQSLSGDSSVRVIVLSGAGKVFSAGADVNWMRASIDLSSEENRDDALRMARLFSTIAGTRCPVIVRAHGAAIGGGAGLVCAGDIAVAEKQCMFSFSEVRLGIIPAVISPHAVARIGAQEARRWFLTGERFSTEVAQRIGMIHEICEGDQLDEKIDQIVAAVLRSGPEAVQEAKRLIREVSGLPTPESLAEFTADRIAARRASQEGQAGLQSFLDGIDPPWIDDAQSKSADGETG
ncbi:MAG: enoyl-CoA hydratase-related protein [Planctomycetota bacterium]